MTLEDLKSDSNYDAIFNLSLNIQYLTLSGSKAYGTNLPTSDTDIRGFFLEQKNDLYGLTAPKEEHVYPSTDTTLYSFKRFMTLLANCNPNTIELIGTREQDVIYQTDLAKEVRNNYHLFLSKKAFKTFIGYATQQLRRLQNALARDSYPQSEKEVHIKKSIEGQFLSGGMPNCIPVSSFNFNIKDSDKEDLEKEIYVSVHVDDVPLRDFLNTQSTLSNTLKNFDKLNHRNRKKDAEHLNKHAMHLIRLYYMGMDILEKEEINTYREKEHDLLLSIRKGEITYEDIFKLQKELEEKLLKSYEHSKLPDSPRLEEISDFTIKMFKKYL